MPGILDGTLEARSNAARFVADGEFERSVKYRRLARRVVRLSGEAVLLALLVAVLFLRFPEVEGRSMQPNIAQGDHVLINALAYDFRIGALNLPRHLIQRGDIVAFTRYSPDQQRVFLKRVIAIAGDSVTIDRGQVLVNQQPVQRFYRTISFQGSMARRSVPAGTVFVLGDNLADSDDSRSFGVVQTSSIIGKAMLVIWPLGSVRPIN